MKCEYCNQELNGETCAHCGAVIESIQVQEYKSSPFAYDGFIVWDTYDYASREHEFAFCRGMDLMGSVKISDREIRYLGKHYEPGTSYMPYVFKKFLVENGEVISWVDPSRASPVLEVDIRVKGCPVGKLELAPNKIPLGSHMLYAWFTHCDVPVMESRGVVYV